MRSYVIQRILLAIPTVLLIFTVVFLMGYFAPSDPVTIMLNEKGTPENIARLKRQYGLDLPLWQQYVNYLGKVLNGSLGESYAYPGQTVGAMIAQGLPRSAAIAVFAILLTTVIAVPFGIVAALWRNTWIDRVATLVVITGNSVPHFVMAFACMYVISYKLQLLPVAGWGTWRHAVLPVLILGARPAAFIMRLTRSSMLEVLNQDYIRTARAKGLAEMVVVAQHALKNALIPVITALATTFGALLTGSFFIEQIFAIPGIGRMSVTSINLRDYPAIQGVTILIATVFVTVNLLVDVLYCMIDPRIRYN
jgi:ABC-type dipeptide/oligopeptide/nickel transport system permease component